MFGNGSGVQFSVGVVGCIIGIQIYAVASLAHECLTACKFWMALEDMKLGLIWLVTEAFPEHDSVGVTSRAKHQAGSGTLVLIVTEELTSPAHVFLDKILNILQPTGIDCPGGPLENTPLVNGNMAACALDLLIGSALELIRYNFPKDTS